MLRTRRATLSLIRALATAAAAPALAFSAVTMMACQDESQPEYWVEKLDDNAWRARAVKQLDQFYEDAVTKANQDQNSPELKGLVEKIVVPLSNTYSTQYDNLDEKARHRLIKLLATMRDPRTEPALTKAIAEFAEKGRGGEDLKWAARAAADLDLRSTADEMIGAFSKLRADSEEGGAVWRDMMQSMIDMADKSWTPKLVAALEPDMALPQPGEQSKEKVSDFRNQQFWQTTAVRVLGEIGDPAGVDALLEVMLDPTKAPLQVDAAISLVKLGKPAITRATAVLLGQDQALVEFAALRARKASGSPVTPTDAPHVRGAAVVLGAIGNSAAAPAMMTALEKERNETNQAVLLSEIAKLPPTPQIEQVFKAGFQRIDPDLAIPPGDQPALQVLAEAATSFFDPELVPWLLAEAAKIKGDDDTRTALLVAAIKLMGPEQVASVGAAVDKFGGELEKGVFNEAAGVVKSCGKEASCYLETATKAGGQGNRAQFAGIKAAYMAGVFGDEKVRDKLVAGIDPISNAAVRFTAVKVIDYLTPKGSTSVADELQKVVDANAKRGDQEKIASDVPVKQVIYRLRSRAQS